MSLAPLPTSLTIDTKGNILDRVYQSWFQSIQQYLGPQAQSGVTANRPTANVYIGLTYFDTSLGKPVFAKSATSSRPQVVVWVDATGAVV
jgi:hypothetical protein